MVANLYQKSLSAAPGYQPLASSPLVMDTTMIVGPKDPEQLFDVHWGPPDDLDASVEKSVLGNNTTIKRVEGVGHELLLRGCKISASEVGALLAGDGGVAHSKRMLALVSCNTAHPTAATTFTRERYAVIDPTGDDTMGWVRLTELAVEWEVPDVAGRHYLLCLFYVREASAANSRLQVAWTPTVTDESPDMYAGYGVRWYFAEGTEDVPEGDFQAPTVTAIRSTYFYVKMKVTRPNAFVRAVSHASDDWELGYVIPQFKDCPSFMGLYNNRITVATEADRRLRIVGLKIRNQSSGAVVRCAVLDRDHSAKGGSIKVSNSVATYSHSLGAAETYLDFIDTFLVLGPDGLDGRWCNFTHPQYLDGGTLRPAWQASAAKQAGTRYARHAAEPCSHVYIAKGATGTTWTGTFVFGIDPIITEADSQGDGPIGGTEDLGPALEDAFGQKRVRIRAGSGGARLTNYGVQQMTAAPGVIDLLEFRDEAVLLFCGMGINDIAGSIPAASLRTALETILAAWRGGEIGNAALLGLPPVGGSNPNKAILDAAVVEWNEQIRQVAAEDAIPFFDPFDLVQAHLATYIEAAGVHYLPPGAVAVASEFADAYEADQAADNVMVQFVGMNGDPTQMMTSSWPSKATVHLKNVDLSKISVYVPAGHHVLVVGQAP